MNIGNSVIQAFAIIFLLVTANIEMALSQETERKIVLMWQVPKNISDEDLQTMKSAGVTTIQSLDMTRWSDDQLSVYLDLAQKHGLKVTIYLGHILDRGDGPDDWSVGTRAESFIQRWKRHNAIAAWHTFDEPKEAKKRASKFSQGTVYKQVKALDPERPVLISTNLVSQKDYEQFFNEEAFDILDLHAYVNSSVSKRQMNLVGFFKQNRKRQYPIIVTMRAFNGPQWKDIADSSLQEQYNYFVKDSRLTANLGFYGWKLSPNQGISQVEQIRKQFLELKW